MSNTHKQYVRFLVRLALDNNAMMNMHGNTFDKYLQGRKDATLLLAKDFARRAKWGVI